MNKLSIDLLAMDTLAHRFGCGLNPALRRALETDVRFPSRAASPPATPAQMQAPLPANAIRLSDHNDASERKKA